MVYRTSELNTPTGDCVGLGWVGLAVGFLKNPKAWSFSLSLPFQVILLRSTTLLQNLWCHFLVLLLLIVVFSSSASCSRLVDATWSWSLFIYLSTLSCLELNLSLPSSILVLNSLVISLIFSRQSRLHCGFF